MPEMTPYFPQPIFGGDPAQGLPVPRVIIAPQRYIQGKGTLDHIGRYISIIPSTRPMILISAGGKKRFGDRIRQSMADADAAPVFHIFDGECSYETVAKMVILATAEQKPVDSVIAVGGGKCLDTAKCIAFRLRVPVIICPTIASTDAPCSAVSVMYTEDGIGKGPEFFPQSPAMVVMDTGIIAESPLRHLVAGIGDALATFYEARTCFNNPKARNMVGGRPAIIALAIAELCAGTILDQSMAAIEAMKTKTINEALEQIIEANTLLSGMGFESGGLAAAHGVAAGLTVIPVLHKDFLHGELVGIGVLTQLVLEKNMNEAVKIAKFFATVGLPVHLGQLSLDADKDLTAITEAMNASVASQLVASEPFEVNPGMLLAAFLEADRIGHAASRESGNKAYKELHP